METTSHNTQETQELAKKFVEENLTTQGKGARIISLIGELGGGKTTFVQAVAKTLGIEETIISPTFVIERIYKIPKGKYPFKHLVHIDAYRLESGEELKTLGWDELIADPETVIFIEWADRVLDILPHDATEIAFRVKEEDVREVLIT